MGQNRPSNGTGVSEVYADRSPNEEVPQAARGTLLIIGGNENKEGHRPILAELASRVGSGKLVVVTMASEEPEEQWKEYSRTFRDIGLKNVVQLDARSREDLVGDNRLKDLEGATGIFFAGGDQLKITSKMGGTPVCGRMREIFEQGGLVAGTSSGASVMSDVMMAAGEGQNSEQVGSSLQLAAGLGLLSGVIIDQHFAERGRMGRLMGAVAQNPRLLGLGIDEDTALVCNGDRDFTVMGSGAVYVLDGRQLTHTNASADGKLALSAFGFVVHVLKKGDRFDLVTRTPAAAPAEPTRDESNERRK
jgi:cyanophycinase